MAYSCTDFTDDILAALKIKLPRALYDDPAGQAQLACEVIARLTANANAGRKALETIIAHAPEQEPEPEQYDDTESAFNNGEDCGGWAASERARAGLAEYRPLGPIWQVEWSSGTPGAPDHHVCGTYFVLGESTALETKRAIQENAAYQEGDRIECAPASA